MSMAGLRVQNILTSCMLWLHVSDMVMLFMEAVTYPTVPAVVPVSDAS